ncbi:MAG: hypothetical protein D6798_09670, partial [Deltaproteobacteria bacterium]
LDLCDDDIDQDCDGVFNECSMAGELDADVDAWLTIHRTRGEDPVAMFGQNLAHAGDSNGDGVPEVVGLVVEEPQADLDPDPVPIPYVLIEIPSGTSGGDRTLDAQTMATWPMPDPDTWWTGMAGLTDTTIVADQDLDGDGYTDFIFSTRPTQSETVRGRVDLSFGPAVGQQDLDAEPTLRYPSDSIEFQGLLELVQPAGSGEPWTVAAVLAPVHSEDQGTLHPAIVLLSEGEFAGDTELVDAPTIWADNSREAQWNMETADLDGDGVADLIVTLSVPTTAPRTSAQVAAFQGPLDGASGFTDADLVVNGGSRDTYFGRSHCVVDGPTRDGEPRLAIGMPESDDRPDGMYGFFPVGDLSTPRTLSMEERDATLISDDDTVLSTFFSCADVGDVDGDGRNEMSVAVYADRVVESVALYEAPASGTVDASSYDAALIDHEDPATAMGAAVLGGVDYDGDGLSDLVIGAPAWHGGKVGSKYYYSYIGRILIFRGAGPAR